MDADEREICSYLKSWPGQFVSLTQIARRASGKRRFQKEPAWPVKPLQRLVDQGQVETDATGHYRLKQSSRKEKKGQRWISPQMQQILARSGKKFDETQDLEQAVEGENPVKE